MAGQRNPDIQRLLANLRGSQTQLDSTQPQPETTLSSQSIVQRDNSVSYTGSIPGLGLLTSAESKLQRVSITPPSTQQAIPSVAVSIQSRPATPVIADASIITTWPAALKHVTKSVITNEKAAGQIKHLISQQHKHERQWWAGREAILTRHSNRAGNQAKAAALLKSLGGATIPLATHDANADQAELDAYDRKVYKSLTDMTADFDRQLRGLQVPFFAIKHNLVILEDGASKTGESKGRLDKGELRELQRRMVETLEDLLGED